MEAVGRAETLPTEGKGGLLKQGNNPSSERHIVTSGVNLSRVKNKDLRFKRNRTGLSNCFF